MGRKGQGMRLDLVHLQPEKSMKSLGWRTEGPVTSRLQQSYQGSHRNWLLSGQYVFRTLLVTHCVFFYLALMTAPRKPFKSSPACSEKAVLASPMTGQCRVRKWRSVEIWYGVFQAKAFAFNFNVILFDFNHELFCLLIRCLTCWLLLSRHQLLSGLL